MRHGKGADPAIAVVVVLLLLLCVASPPSVLLGAKGEEELTTQLINGFTATHAAGSAAAFEPVLYATSGVFALGFLRVGAASLDLAVVHLPSSFPVWRATPARLGDWSRPATLTFDSSLVLTTGNDGGGVLWRTLNTIGDTVSLLNSSNLVVQRYAKTTPTWQSFEHPSDTLLVDQNFTAASTPLVSANRRFALRLGKTYMALHMEFAAGGGGQAVTATPMYWKHTALEAQPENATAPPVYGRVDGRGFFGLYLEGGPEVDVLSFDTFALNLTGVFRRMTLDDDGNLRAYYWTRTTTGGDAGKAAWTSDYDAIAERCELPTSCGAYGLCVPGTTGNAECQCLLDGGGGGTSSTSSSSGGSPPCVAEEETTTTAADGLCGTPGAVGFDVVRRTRVSVAYKELLPLVTTNTTAGACEVACAGNCSCWGAVFNGGSGYCYLIDFPVETMVYQADDRMLGYFKVRKAAAANSERRRRRGLSPGVTAATVVLSLVLVALAAAGAYLGYRMWEKRKRKRAGMGMYMEQELAPGPYKDLKSMASSNSNSSFKA